MQLQNITSILNRSLKKKSILNRWHKDLVVGMFAVRFGSVLNIKVIQTAR